MSKREKPLVNRIFDQDLTWAYHQYDKMYFGGKLDNLEVFYAVMPARKNEFRYGCTAFNKRGRPIYIAINRILKNRCEDTAYLTLLHEMCHVKLGYRSVEHGRNFVKERRRLIVLGAFDELI